MKTADFIQYAETVLSSLPLDGSDPKEQAKRMLEHVCQFSRTDFYLKLEEPLTSEQVTALESLLHKKCQGIPLQYLLGYEYFWKDRFSVGPGVFIPRRETEQLVEILVSMAKPGDKVAELGPGTGMIGISFLRDRPDCSWFAVEKNPDTVPYLQRNLHALLSDSDKFQFKKGDFFQEVTQHGSFDWLVSNPPYIASEKIKALSLEVKSEPILALEGGVHGTEVIEKLIEEAPHFLKPGGRLLLEIGEEQGDFIKSLLHAKGFSEITLFKDYAGFDRVLFATLKEGEHGRTSNQGA
jgi:release factor glutamine methyltransferase